MFRQDHFSGVLVIFLLAELHLNNFFYGYTPIRYLLFILSRVDKNVKKPHFVDVFNYFLSYAVELHRKPCKGLSAL